MTAPPLPTSIDGVLDVELLRGAEAPADSQPDLLVEVPHGADRRSHYDALRARLQGELPADLHCFFHMNTDVGAWSYGRAAAELVLEAQPTRTALILRCLLPRTFVDCNRPADFEGTQLTSGGLTAGVPSYVTDERDLALLLDLHRTYVQAVAEAYGAVCGEGGRALVPHTYGPETLPIQSVGADIVEQLRWAYAPEQAEQRQPRAEVDLLTRDKEGLLYAPPGAEEALLAGFAAAGFQAVANDTYCLVPAALGYQWSTSYPGQVLTLEVRRDLLVERWDPFEEMLPVPEKVARVAQVLAPVLHR